MRSAKVFLTVPGAHHAAVLFMRPGTVWAELLCPKVAESFYWFHGFRHLVASLGVIYRAFTAENCPDDVQEVADISNPPEDAWIQPQGHPISLFSLMYGWETLKAHNQFCAWRNVTAEDVKQAKANARLPSDKEAVVLETAPDKDTAMSRCMAWEQDCQVIRHVDGLRGSSWQLLRSPSGLGHEVCKQACTYIRDGFVQLVDKSQKVHHSLYDVDLRAPPDLAEKVKLLVRQVNEL